ncbi:hypothetical protein E4U56_006435 [Claviceps arundinis]|uniref:DUF4142 domain-containing protein n=1 Tax=Claviceps arundinis TaxID=1623583 RepID=A0A9P7MLA1_9HYPO|nr:hypothetical protein E4U56_006435 [Claviceps arundinis]
MILTFTIDPIIKMRLLTLLPFACGALALATGPVRRPADQQAVDGDATVSLQNAVLADHEITQRDEKASQSLEKRTGFSLKEIALPTESSPAAMVFAGIKITFTMALHWVKLVGGEWVYEPYVQAMHVVNEVNERLAVQIVAAGQTLLDTHMSALAEATANPQENAGFFDLFISEVNNEL